MSPSTRRMVVLVIVGGAAGSVVALLGPWQLAVLIGWIAALLCYLVERAIGFQPEQLFRQ